MSYPVIEQIAQKLKARLETITVANGYNQTVCSVVRPTRTGGFSPSDKLIVLQQGDGVRDEENDYAGNPNAIAWMQPFIVQLYVRPSDRDITPVDTIINVFAADAIKAIGSPNNWHTWDGLAFNTFIRDPQSFAESQGEHEGVELQIDVNYRVNENDPYTAR